MHKGVMTQSICGSFLTDRRSLVAFTWTLTTVLTFFAFVMALVMMVHVHTRYKRLEHYYEQQWEYNQEQYNYNNNQGGGGQGGEPGGGDRQSEYEKQIQQLLMLSTMSSKSMTFVAVYTMTLAIGLSLYGSTAIVGFTSLRGVYIAPCFSATGSPKLRLGIFGGAIIFFANMLLVCAVVFGEVRVEDWQNGRDRDEREPYEIERLATVLAVTCMFLAALYTIFAVLLFLYFGNDEDGNGLDGDVVRAKPLTSITNDPRRENFITIGQSEP